MLPTSAVGEVEKVEGYLAWKWGLEGNLPAAHPYKSAPPAVGPSPPSFSSALPSDGNVSVGYSHTFTANGSPAPTFSMDLPGSLPAGLTWTAVTATISGTPTGVETSPTITVTASNGNAPDATQLFTIAISAIPPPTAYFEWDAALDTGGDSTWPSTGTTAYTWTFDAGAQTPADVTGGRFFNVTKAYAFPGALVLNSPDWTPHGDKEPATFEFVVDIDADDGLFFETGGSTGISFGITAGVIRGCYKGDIVTYTPTAGEKDDFLHVVFVVDMAGDVFQLYVDGELKASVTGIATDWSGTNNAGLGGSSSTVNGGDPGDFTGKMAIFRFYRNQALIPQEIELLYDLLGLNQPPDVNLTAPTEGQKFASGVASITLKAMATDDSAVDAVEFRADGAWIGDGVWTDPTWDFTWTLPADGTYALTAFATDDEAATMVSAPEINITVGPVITVEATDATATENGDGGVFTFTRTALDNSGAIVVNYIMSGDASAGDYTLNPSGGTVTIADGNSTATVTLTTVNDDTGELSEDAIITLDSTNPGTLGATVTATITIADDDADPSLIGHWKLDNDATPLIADDATADDGAGDEYDGTLTGMDGTEWTASGKIDGALTLDGVNDYVVIANEAAFDIYDELTVSCWVKVTGGWLARRQTFVSKDGSSSGLGWRLSRVKDTDKITFVLRGTSGDDQEASGAVTTIASDGLWHHIAATFDGVRRKTYIDGVIDIDIPDTGMITPSDTAVRIGQFPGGNRHRGDIDDVRIYNRALSAAEVQALVDDAAPKPGTLAFSAADYAVAEGDTGTTTVTVTVKRTGGTNGAVSVDYSTADNTATSSYGDYETAFGTLNWADGDGADKTFTVTINGDTEVESDEIIDLTLSNPTGGATLGTQSTASITIATDDTLANSITVGPDGQAEGFDFEFIQEAVDALDVFLDGAAFTETWQIVVTGPDRDSFLVPITLNTTTEHRLVIRSVDDELVILSPGQVLVETDNVTISGFEIGGITIRGGDDCRIENCRIEGSISTTFSPDLGSVSGLEIVGNTVDLGGQSLSLGGDHFVERNVFISSSVSLSGMVQNNVFISPSVSLGGMVRNCTFYSSGDLNLSAGSATLDLRNNIFYAETEITVQLWTGTEDDHYAGLTSDYNNWATGNVRFELYISVFIGLDAWRMTGNDLHSTIDYPDFENPSSGDFHLRSSAGRWDPDLMKWVNDGRTSPCVDRGDPSIPVGDETAPNNNRINMGAYGGTVEASRSSEIDSDGDGLSDDDEINVYYTNPNNSDTDGDGFSDYDEIFVYSGLDPLVPFGDQMTWKPILPSGISEQSAIETLQMGDATLGGVTRSPKTRFNLPAKMRRVDVHGVPLPDPSPTGEGESDRIPNSAEIDMFNLAPTYNVTDVAVPIEGGELTLEFRRTCGIRSRIAPRKLSEYPIVYPNDTPLGFGWDPNLSARLVINIQKNDVTKMYETIASVTDDVGNSYRFMYDGVSWTPYVEHGFNNQSLLCTLTGGGGSLEFKRAFGTKLLFSSVGAFFRPFPSGSPILPEWYYRLESVTDRNGNSLVYSYEGGMPDANPLEEEFLVTKIHVAAHPEQALVLSWDTIGDHLLIESSWRVMSVTDPLGRQTSYGYIDRLLKTVSRPEVWDDESNDNVQPIVTIDYRHDPCEDEISDQLYEFVAPSAITDARGHTTTFGYNIVGFPQLVVEGATPKVKYKFRPCLWSVRTDDGQAIFGHTVARGLDSVQTYVTDTRSTTTNYEFLIEHGWASIGNPASWVYKISRGSPGGLWATFDYSADLSNRLQKVTDLSGNVIDYSYAGVTPNNHPTRRVIDPNGLNLVTTYVHELAFNKMESMTDAEGMVTKYVFDGFGNRTQVIEAFGTALQKTTHYAYDGEGFVTQITDPDGRVTEFAKSIDSEKLEDPEYEPDLDAHRTIITRVRGYGGTEFGEHEIESVSVSDVMGTARYSRDANGSWSKSESDALYRPVKTIFDLDGDAITVGVKTLLDINGNTITIEGWYDPAGFEENPADPAAGDDVVSLTFYNLNGGVTRTVDPHGDVTINTYDPMNRVTETRRRMDDPSADHIDDIVTTTDYFGSYSTTRGQVDSTVDANGNVTAFEYDDLLRLARKTLATGDTEDYLYGPNSGSGAFSRRGWQPTRVTNPRGKFTDTVYDNSYRAKTTIRRGDAGDAEPTVETVYNDVHNTTSTVVWNELADGTTSANQKSYTFYDSLHRPTVSVIDMDGSGLSVSEGTVVDDAEAFAADPGDIVSRTVYDLAGNVVATIDAEGNKSESRYDGAGRVVRTLAPAVTDASTGEVWRPESVVNYDANGNKILAGVRAYDENSPTKYSFDWAAMEYDRRNLAIKTAADPDGSLSTQIIDATQDLNDAVPAGPAMQNFSSVDDIITRTEFDLLGSAVKTIDPLGNETDMTYDRAGRLVQVVGPAVFDAENPMGIDPNFPDDPGIWRPISMSVYDKNGNVTTAIDPRGVETLTVYDELNRPLRVTAASNTADAVTTETEYDENGNVLALVLNPDLADGDYQKQRTDYEYDAFDRQTDERLPEVAGELPADRRHTFTEYYRNGSVKKVTDPKGQVVDSYFDLAGRVTQTVHSNSIGIVEETRDFTYDLAGNVLTLSDVSGNTTYTYDKLDRVLTETRVNVPELPYTVTNTYDLAANRLTVAYTQGKTLVSAYDPLNRLVDVREQGAANGVVYAYDKNGNRASCTYPNSVTNTYTYDALNRVDVATTKKSDLSTVYSVGYEYDLVGNRINIDETSLDADDVTTGTRYLHYEYDERYQLTREWWNADDSATPDVGADLAYTYDLAGNRLELWKGNTPTTAYSYNARNEIKDATTGGIATTYTYDDNGNRMTKSVGGGGTNTDYFYDTSNRLISADVDAAEVFTATYDYRTRRVSKTEGGDVTIFRYDGGVSFDEWKDTAGNAVYVKQVEFVRGSGMGGGIGSILYSDRSTVGGPKEYFVYSPAVGHTVATLLEDESVKSTNLYEAFGNVVKLVAGTWDKTDGPTSGSSVNNRLASTKERDKSIGLDNHGFRYYDPEIGRYTTRDPIGYKGGMNVYIHAQNNPINLIDPLGLSTERPEGLRIRLGDRDYSWNPDTGVVHHKVIPKKGKSYWRKMKDQNKTRASIVRSLGEEARAKYSGLTSEMMEAKYREVEGAVSSANSSQKKAIRRARRQLRDRLSDKKVAKLTGLKLLKALNLGLDIYSSGVNIVATIQDPSVEGVIDTGVSTAGSVIGVGEMLGSKFLTKLAPPMTVIEAIHGTYKIAKFGHGSVKYVEESFEAARSVGRARRSLVMAMIEADNNPMSPKARRISDMVERDLKERESRARDFID